MEVFSLLKFWRNAGATDSSVGDAFSEVDFSTESSYDLRNPIEEEFDDDEDSFFDLVFTSPDRDTKRTKCSTTAVKINDDFGRNPSKLDGDSKSNFMESPTDVFYKSNSLNKQSNSKPRNSSKLDGDSKSNFMESPTDVFYKSTSLNKQSNSKPQSPISFLKSSPKLRVFMFGFSKPKLVKSQVSCASMAATASNQLNSSKRFTVNCQIEEVPIASILTRDNSLRAKLKTDMLDNSSTDERSKRFPKDVANKYLNLIKPLYVKSSKRYTDKSRFSEQSPTVTPSSSPATVPASSPRKQVEEKQGSRTAVFRNLTNYLGKSRSVSRSLTGKVNPSPSSRRDDSVFQQQDGIQGAILHCKRSFDSSAHGCSVPSRSESAPAHGKSTSQPRISVNEEKRSSI